MFHHGGKDDEIMQVQLYPSLVPIFKGFSHGVSNIGEKFVMVPGQRVDARL